MQPRKLDEVSGGTSNRSRREALTKFGRYAAIAPAVMVLLQSRASFAGKGKRYGRGGRWGGGQGKHGYDKHY